MRRANLMALTLSLAIGIALLFNAVACTATGSSFPTKEITYIVAWAQGGAADGIARALAEATSPHLGKPIVVKNVVGGAGTYGTAELAKAKPDGYTVAQQQYGPVVIQPHVAPVPYKSPDDFEILSMVFSFPYLISVRADSPIKNLDDMVAEAKKRPGQITYSFSGVGGGGHLAMEGLLNLLGIKMKIVPFPSTVEGVTNMLGGHVEASLSHPPDVATHIKEGRVRPIASLNKFPGIEEIPGLKSVKELGIDYEKASWSCNIVPKGVPKDVLEKLRVAFKKGIEEKSFVDYMKKTYQPILYLPAEEVLEKWKADYVFHEKIVKELGLAK